jgi:hypothetical protein
MLSSSYVKFTKELYPNNPAFGIEVSSVPNQICEDQISRDVAKHQAPSYCATSLLRPNFFDLQQ